MPSTLQFAMTSEWLTVGKIVAPQGLRGEVRVLSYSDFPERFLVPGERWLQPPQGGDPQPIALKNGRALPGKTGVYVIKLAGVDDRERAETLRGYLLLVDSRDRLPLAEGEYHVGDLVGCTVVHQPTGQTIGVVTAVLAAGNDVLEVADGRNGDRKALVPFVQAIVPVVDVGRQRIEVAPPPGLVDELLERTAGEGT